MVGVVIILELCLTIMSLSKAAAMIMMAELRPFHGSKVAAMIRTIKLSYLTMTSQDRRLGACLMWGKLKMVWWKVVSFGLKC